MDEVAVFPAASETFSRRNINQTIDEALAAGEAGLRRGAGDAGLPVRAYLSTSFGCPFEGAVPPQRVAELTARLIDLGAYEVSLSDTIGVAHPGQVADVLGDVTQRVSRVDSSRCTFTTRAARRSSTSTPASRQASRRSMRRPAGSADVRTRQAPPATSRPRTSLYLLDGLGIATGVQTRRRRRRLARDRTARRPSAALAHVPRARRRPDRASRSHRAGPTGRADEGHRDIVRISKSWRRHHRPAASRRRRLSRISSRSTASRWHPAARRCDHRETHRGAPAAGAQYAILENARVHAGSRRARSFIAQPRRSAPIGAGFFTVLGAAFYLTFERENLGAHGS